MHNDLLSILLAIRRPDEVKALVTKMMSEGKFRFEPIGERTNSNHIELADEAISPLVERITNGIDAVLERTEIEKRDGTPLPASPRAAAQQWLGIRSGHLDTLSLAEIHKLADNIEITFHESGEEKSPTVVIRDFGIGQHPDALDSTILSLGKSNKIGKHYLCGAYGHGGSSTLAWCNYSIIISRTRPEHAPGKPDLIGWTIVRKNQDDDTVKTTVYEYLVNEDKTVLSIDPTKSEIEFPYGTYIAHIAYELDKYAGPASLVGYRLFQHKLFDPVLPYWITDTRQGSGKEKQFRRALAGNLRRLRGRDVEGGKSQVEYNNEYEADLGEDGKVTVRYWVFKVKPQDAKAGKNEEKFFLESYLDTRNSAKSIPITLNGQQQHCLDKRFVKQEIKLPFLADYLLVQVECEQLASRRKKDIFVATRKQMREGPKRLDLIKGVVIDALKNDERLRKIEEQRADATLAKMDEKSEKEVRSLLDRLITSPQLSMRGGLVGSDEGPGGELLTFEPKDPPTFLEFVTQKDIIEIMPGETKKILLEMDGPDDLFTRKANRASFSAEIKGMTIKSEITSIKMGRIELLVSIPSDADPNFTGTLVCSIEMKGMPVPLVAEKDVMIVPLPPPYTASDPPTFIQIAGRADTPLYLKRGGRTNISIITDATDDILTRLLNPAVFDFECTVNGASFVGKRGLSEGTMRLQISVPDSTSDGTTGKLVVRLRLHNGTILEDMRDCVVVPPPEKNPPKQQGGGARQRPEPNYELVQVKKGDSNWINFGWDESNVGKYEKSSMLYLYVSYDFAGLNDERERRKKSGEGVIPIERMWKRYFAHVAYHLYLCAKAETSANVEPKEDLNASPIYTTEAALKEEMQRVGQTIILLLRSLTDLKNADE